MMQKYVKILLVTIIVSSGLNVLLFSPKYTSDAIIHNVIFNAWGSCIYELSFVDEKNHNRECFVKHGCI